MEPDDINAIGMVLMPVLTVLLLLILTVVSPKTNFIDSLGLRLVVAIGGGIACFIFMGAALTSKCVESAAPFGQVLVTSFCIMTVFLFGRRIEIIILCYLLIACAGFVLGNQFNKLVNFPSQYTAIDVNTHKAISKGCEDSLNVSEAKTQTLWHSSFTGIYKIAQ